MKSVLVSAAWYEFTTSQAAHARLNSPTRIKVATRGRALKPARWQESLICSRVRLDGINLNGDANTLGSDRFVPFYHRTARPNPPVGRLVPFVAAGKLMGVHKAFAGGTSAGGGYRPGRLRTDQAGPGPRISSTAAGADPRRAQLF